MSSNELNGLGLDELMIVNPVEGGLSAMFFGRDGDLYGIEETGETGFYLGADNLVYQTISGGNHVGLGQNAPQFFLSDDGTLYGLTAER
jgi:hypothetical protein